MTNTIQPSPEYIPDNNDPVPPYNYWDDHPNFPSIDWRHETSNNYTRQGYWEWVKGKIQQKKYDTEEISP